MRFGDGHVLVENRRAARCHWSGTYSGIWAPYGTAAPYRLVRPARGGRVQRLGRAYAESPTGNPRACLSARVNPLVTVSRCDPRSPSVFASWTLLAGCGAAQPRPRAQCRAQPRKNREALS